MGTAVGCVVGVPAGASAQPDAAGSTAPPPPAPDAATDAGAVTMTSAACSGAGIAAYADQLVKTGRASCTQDGVGVVKADDYACMKSAIDTANPQYADASFNIVSTLLANNTAYPFYECTYFVQTVTAGVCDVPISPADTAWTAYPYACSFINKTAAGFDWIAKAGGVVEVGDILMLTSTDGCNNDPGHIMIVAEIKDSTHFRIAEANELAANGSPGTAETGVISNTRIQSLDDPALAPGWFRLHAN